MNKIFSTCALLLVSALLAACSPASDGPAFPTGTFKNPDDRFSGYIFKADNTWQYLSMGSVAQEGKYQVKGSQWIEQGTEECPFPGAYEWTFDGTNLTFKLAGEDKCDPRREATDGMTFVLEK